MEKVFKDFHLKRKTSHSFVINILAQALHAVFLSSTGNGSAERIRNHKNIICMLIVFIEHMNNIRQACFEYFKLGGRCTSDPVALLSV